MMMMMTNVITIDNDDGDCQYCAYDDGDYVIIFLLIMVMIWRSALSLWRCWWYVDVDDDDEIDCYQNGGDGIIRWRLVIKDDDEFLTILKKTFTIYWDKTTKLVSRFFTKVTSNAKRNSEKASNVTRTFTVIYSPVCNQIQTNYSILYSRPIPCRNVVDVQAATLWVKSEGWTNLVELDIRMYFECVCSVER